MNGDRYFDGDAFPEDFFPGTDGDEGHGGFDGQDEIERTFELEEKELNQKILFRTVRALERSMPDWKFLGLKLQRKLIKQQFEFNQALIMGDDVDLDDDDLDPEEKD